MGGANICQIRLDFLSGTTLLAPVDGACGRDELSVNTAEKTAAQVGIGALCGALGDQHLYVDVSTAGSPMAATLNIATNTDSGARKWKILIRQVECNGDLRAPSGCRQYFTATSGRISSFNGQASVTTAADAMMIVNQRYNICIKRGTGMNAVTLREARATPASFVLDAVAIDRANGMAANDELENVKSAVGTSCTEKYIEFAGTRLCGSLLSSAAGETIAGVVTGNDFTIGVVSDASDPDDLTTGAFATGFDLIYSQS